MLAVLIATIGCDHDKLTERRLGRASESWTHDSIAYERALTRWLRDSVVVDSIAATIDATHLRSIYASFATSQRPETLMQEAVCEEARLARRHGGRVGQAVVERTDNEVWRSPQERRRIFRRLESRVKSSFMLGVSEDHCGPLGPRGPDTVAGIDLRTLPARPEPPVRP
jgi:hypothetical protein